MSDRKGYGRHRHPGYREWSMAICSDCGIECEVPFQVAHGQQVYCPDCLSRHRKNR